MWCLITLSEIVPKLKNLVGIGDPFSLKIGELYEGDLVLQSFYIYWFVGLVYLVLLYLNFLIFTLLYWISSPIYFINKVFIEKKKQ